MRASAGPAIAAVVLVLSVVPGVSGQGLEAVFPRPSFMIGYVANAPRQMLGGGAAYLPERLRGWGVYADVKTVTNSPADEDHYAPETTVAEAEVFGDVARAERSAWRSVNLALVRAFRDDVILYLGGGASKETPYIEYFDASQERGQFGYYWVRDEGREAWRPNAMAGMYFRLMRHIAFQFGGELAPAGVTAGALLVF